MTFRKIRVWQERHPILRESHAEERLLNHDSVRRQDLNPGLLVIPAQAGIQIAALDSRLRGNDGTQGRAC
jgi:hypothetical protein